MPELSTVLAVLICLQVKHFVADYLLQPGWMLAGKGDLRMIGGYAHAGAHALASVPALLLAGLGIAVIAALLLAEVLIHYIVDYTKAGVSTRRPSSPNTREYWALHGADQLAHHLTYAAMLSVIVLAM